MDTMNIPGFTAESALYRSSNRYRSHLSPSQSINGVTPQWCCQDSRNCEQCLSGCTDGRRVFRRMRRGVSLPLRRPSLPIVSGRASKVILGKSINQKME